MSSWQARNWLADRVAKVSAELAIINARGLHARASAKFVKLAAGFSAKISVTRDDQTVPGTSIMGLMMLGAGPGSTIHVEADGPDADAALSAISALVAGKFNEE